MNKLLGSRIRALRRVKGFTQEQVANRIGVSMQRYARIESGFSNIGLDILSKVAEVLGVTVGDITMVLDEPSMVVYKTRGKDISSNKIFDMLDLFYANKHVCEKLQHKNMNKRLSMVRR